MLECGIVLTSKGVNAATNRKVKSEMRHLAVLGLALWATAVGALVGPAPGSGAFFKDDCLAATHGQARCPAIITVEGNMTIAEKGLCSQ